MTTTVILVGLAALALALVGVLILKYAKQIAIALLAIGAVGAVGAGALAMMRQATATNGALRVAHVAQQTSQSGPGLLAPLACLGGFVAFAGAAGVAYLAARWAIRERRMRHELERNIGGLRGGQRRSKRQLPQQAVYPGYPVIVDLDDIEESDDPNEPFWWWPDEWGGVQ
jgi:hypothetical protein